MAYGLDQPEIHDIKISNATLKVAIGGGLSLMAGLVSQVITAYLFGAGKEMDAFFTASTIPLYLQIVLLGGLPFVVIPAFVRQETSGHEEDAWAIAGTFIWLTGGVLLVAAAVGALLSSQIISLTAPGFGFTKSELASKMLSVLMFTVPFIGLGNLTSGVQNVRGRFFWPATATAIGSVGNLVTLLVLYRIMGALALAIGSLVSAVLFATVTTVPVVMHGWKKTVNLKDPNLIEMIKLITPFLFFGLITNGKMILERYFASALPDGQLSYIGYAYKISNIFVILLATSIASVIFPAMARAFSAQGVEGLAKQSDFGLRVTLALALPAVMITSALSVPLVRIFFERGAFVPAATLSVSLLIPIVLLQDVFFRMVNNMVGRTFFVLKDTLTTNLISSLTIIVYILAAKIFTEMWGYWGLALAQPIQSGLVVGITSCLLLKRIKQFSVKPMMKSFLIYGLISLVAAIMGWFIIQLFNHFPTIVQLAIGGIISISVYLSAMYVIDKAMLTTILDMFGLPKFYSTIKARIISAREPPSG